jgi:hypothetical protein
MKTEYYIIGALILLIVILIIAMIVLIKKKIPSEVLKNISDGIKSFSEFSRKANSEIINGVANPSNMRMNTTTIIRTLSFCIVMITIKAVISWESGSLLQLVGLFLGIIITALGFKNNQKAKEMPGEPPNEQG